MTLTQITKAGLHDIALDHVFTIGASGTDHYTFQGEGLNGTVNDPTLYLTRGKTYRFENGTGAHAIRIQSADDGTSGTLYNTGVTNNNTTGTVIVEVQHDAPDVLYYQCASHANMKGTIYVTGALADGGVTTAKIADDAVTNAKIGALAVGRTEIATNAISSDKIDNGQITTAKIADDAITSAKIADGTIVAANIANDTITAVQLANNSANINVIVDGAVATSKIADQAVTLDKLPHGTSSNDGKFLRANNGADPTFETVNTDLVSDTSPQLGGNLDTNSHEISLDTSHAVNFGDSNELTVKYHGGHGQLVYTGNNSLQLKVKANSYFQVVNNDTGDNIIQAQAGGNILIYHAGSQVAQTSANGLAFPSGKGIDFSDDSSGTLKTLANSFNAEVLHDYEVGTFVPNISYDTGTNQYSGSVGSGGSVSAAKGEYIRIGDMVWAAGEITLTTNRNSTQTVHISIGGFPYNGLHSSEQSSLMSGWGGAAWPKNDSNHTYRLIYSYHNYTTLNFYFTQTAGNNGIDGFRFHVYYRCPT